LAVGGDLSARRLVSAYASGIFPWFSEGDPIYWFSPDPRCVLVPSTFKASRSLRKSARRFQVSFDQHFSELIRACANTPRGDQPGTWITEEMQRAYEQLHRLGLCHSVEVHSEGRLVGGLYGVSLGAAFFGESMFHLVRDASKVALYALCEHMQSQGLTLLDCQMPTEHLLSLGAEIWPRTQFLASLRACLEAPTQQGRWESERP